jgi:hypothetical protein
MRSFVSQSRPRFYLTLQEAGDRFGVSTQTLADAVRAGALRSRRVERRSWVAPSAVAAFLARGGGTRAGSEGFLHAAQPPAA